MTTPTARFTVHGSHRDDCWHQAEQIARQFWGNTPHAVSFLGATAVMIDTPSVDDPNSAIVAGWKADFESKELQR
jgi:hypothetical protein